MIVITIVMFVDWEMKEKLHFIYKHTNKVLAGRLTFANLQRRKSCQD